MGGENEARAGWAHYHRTDRLRVDRVRLRSRRPPGRARKRAALAGFALALALTTPVALNAATLASSGVSFAVTSPSDAVDASAGDGICRTAAGTCTLRAAIQQANALPGADTITLPAGTYELAIAPLNQNLAENGDLDITDSLTIVGSGAASTIVDGGTPTAGAPVRVRGLDRLFEVLADGGEVTLSGLTLSDGYAAEYGGALMNNSTAAVTISASTLTGNVADKAGGAIDNHLGGAVLVRDSTLSNNVSFESGSALNNNRDGTLTVTSTTISSNSAADIGLDETVTGAGAVANNAELDARGTITVTESLISDNAAGGSRSGAAISNDGAGSLTIERTTFSKNRSESNGGAIFNGAGEVTVSGSTFSENAGEAGGAIYNGAKDGSMTVTESTFSLNSASARGGAIATGGTGSLTVAASRFSKNSSDGWGGAIVNDDKGSVSIRNSTFTDNSGLNGGAFGNEGDGPVTVEGSIFTKNRAFVTAVLASGEGGGMHSNSSGDVAIAESTFSENDARNGGGLGNEGGGSLTISSTRFASNTADEKGGGILIQSGTVRMVDIDVVGNVADAPIEAGGGIAYEGDKLVSVGEAAAIESSRIRDNKAKGQGGGIDSRGDGPLDIATTMIAGNTAAMGGGIHHVGDAPLEVIRSTLSGNFAENGGGVFTDGDGETTVVNSTVSGNRAGQFGGGLLVSSRLNVANSTVANNTGASGGGINNGGGDLVGDGTVFLANTIVASSPTGGNCAGAMTSHGGNVDSGNTCQLRELSDQPGTDPLLGPLADNGGPTQTHALLADSPAQEGALCTDLVLCPSVDQRGVGRPVFALVDAGAYESELTPSGGGSQPCTGRTERPVQADFDSWVSQGTPASNFGGDSILKVKSIAGGNQRALVHFTLPTIPPGCKLVGATLRLYSSSATDGRTLEAVRVAAAWSETGVTWENQPVAAGSAATAQSGVGARTWNVLAQTLAMYADGDHGFLLRDGAENENGEQSLHASEKGEDNPPELVLVFDDPSAPPVGDECPTTPQSLFADRDSWVSEGSPSNNFGTDSALKVKSQLGYNARALVRIPLPTLPAQCTGIASAALRLEAASGTDGRTLEARRIGSDWSETAVTWSNQPATTGAAATTPSVDGPLEWVVTEQVVDMYTSANHGFQIRDAEENGVGDEQTLNGRVKLNDGPPELVLVFDDSTPETTIDEGPVSPTTNTNGVLTFSSDPTDSTFECSLDDGAFADCTSPHVFRELEEGVHVARVRARRNVRAVDPTPATHTWTVAIPPETWIEGPDSPAASSSAVVSFTADDPDATFECSLDEEPFAACTSPVEYTALADGRHEAHVRATDPAGNVEIEAARHVWTVAVPPETSIESGPAELTDDSSATFAFGADETGSSFECQLDGDVWLACDSPESYASLGDGEHVFQVRAIDPAGNVDPTPASRTWVVDTTAPVVTISGPEAETEETSATLAFAVDGDAALACLLNDEALPECASPVLLTELELGAYVLEVRATDAAGNTGTASWSWSVVDVTAPTIALSGPEAETEDTSATFAFSADEDATFACALDGVSVFACASPVTRDGLELGPHRFEVEATDGSGNVGSAAHAWTIVDRTAPVVTISGPEPETEDTSATLVFSANEDATFSCSLDGLVVDGCSSPLERTGLALGEHELSVQAIDASGNVGFAEYSWTVVDRTAPTVTLTGPPAETEDTSATLTFSADEEATFACALDGVAVADCASPLELSGLGLGPHSLVVEAADPSGNSGSATHSWTIVDVTAPTVKIAGPPAETEARSARLTFSADEPAALRCRLDGAAFAACGSGEAEYAGLALGSHTFDVEAEDASGNVGEGSHTWTIVDRNAPVVTISGPPAETEARSAGFTFSADEPASLRCRLDAAPLADCASGAAEYDGLALGGHTFEVEATDPSGNAGSATHAWTIVDRTAPAVTLTGPPAETEEASATLTFSANEPAAFACTLNGADLPGCSSPVELTDLAPGDYVFEARATDASGNAAAATWSWTVVERPPPPDTTPPAISLEGPPDETEETSAAFTFTADEPATFLCALDSSSFTACSAATGATYHELEPGEHRFVVQATDGAGNPASASWSWTILEPPPPPDASAPEIRLDGPDAETEETTATFVFSANEPATFECALDTAAFVPCSAFASYGGLQPGAHEFHLRATDAAGNSATATWLWTIVEPPPPPDTTPPVISLGGPPAETQATDATFTFSANEPASFRCALDGGAFGSCATGVSYAGLALGNHAFVVQATDAAGNIGSASHTWKIVAPPAACTGGTVTASANADSWVLETSPTSNYGHDSILKVDTKLTANAQALVRFALPSIPAGCSLLDARLRLYAGSYKTGRTLQAFALGGAWSENGVTWSTTPATTGSLATAPSGPGYVVWSVAAQVQGMYAGANNGFLVRDVSRTGAGIEQGFHSREKGADNPPQLVLTFG